MKAIKTTEIFDGWIAGLKDRQAVARIRIRIDRLAMGNSGQCRNLKAGVVEMKLDFGPGYRVYFTERDRMIVILLCGGTKKTQDDDIALGRPVDDGLKVLAARRDDDPLGADGQGEAGGECRRRPQAHDGADERHAQLACGSTNIRPFISMCIAWQNQEQ